MSNGKMDPPAGKTQLGDGATVEGEGLQLVPISEADTAQVFTALQDPQVAAPFPYARDGYTPEQARDYTTRFAPSEWKKGNPTWGIHLVDEDGNVGPLVGAIALRNIGANNWDVGFWVTRELWGRGVGTEATLLALSYAFDVLGANRVVHLTQVGNLGSQRVARKAGFQPEGTIRREDKPGVLTRHWQSAILRSDWLAEGEQFRGRPTRPSAKALLGAQPQELVSEFHRVYGMPDRVKAGLPPTLDIDRLGMRMALIKEEMVELVEAVYGPSAANALQSLLDRLPDEGNRDIVEAADALADLTYVIYGMALETGINLDKVLAEVHSSNLSKLMPDGSVRRREDGKILKGPDFREPAIAEILNGQ